MIDLTFARTPAGRIHLGSVHRWAIATLVGQGLIVLVSGAVRLTGSGPSCPVWPDCAAGRPGPTAHPPRSYHRYIELGDRTLTVLLLAILAGALLAAWRAQSRPIQRQQVPSRSRRTLVLLVAAQFAGILVQAGIGPLGGRGGLDGHSPWIVAAHLIVSTALIAAAVAFVTITRPSGSPVAGSVRWSGRAVVASTGLVVLLGAVVTGSGPHAGDEQVHRMSIDPRLATALHSGAVCLLLAAVLLTVILAASGGAAALRGPLIALIALIGGQAIVGIVQYATRLPIGLAELHLAGAVGSWICAVMVLMRSGKPALVGVAAIAAPAP